MRLAAEEYHRILRVVDDLTQLDWLRPTECPGWTVKDVLSHILGMLASQADPAERARQVSMAVQIAQQIGGRRIDAMTGMQVREHAHLSTSELSRALYETVPRALAARGWLTAEQREASYDPGLRGEGPWTLGYLFDVIHTRDPWMHRIDICRATGREPVVTTEHDGRLIADVVAEWSVRHGRPFTLVLTGPAGGRFAVGTGGAHLELDAIAFCRTLSGREPGDDLLATRVPF